MKPYCVFLLAIISFPAFAWVESQNVTIDEVTMWQEADTGVTLFVLSNGARCYIPGDQKNLHSLVLAVYAAARRINAHCHAVADPMAGGSVPPAHRLHRIVALKN